MTETPPPALPAAPAAPRYADESLKDGINRMRETAKWLILTFGTVVNAFILAGIGLADLTDVDDDRLPIALTCVFVAVAAVLVAVVAASRVLTAGQVTATDLKGNRRWQANLREELSKNPDLYAGYGSIGEFVDDMTKATREQVKKARQLFDEEGTEEDARDYRRANKKNMTLRPMSDRLLLVAGFTDIRRKLDFHRWVIAACFLFVVLASVGFTLAIDEDGTAQPATAQTLELVRVDFADGAETQLRAELGRQCDFDSVQAVVLGGDERRLRIATLPRADCRATTLSLGEGQAEVDPLDIPPIALP